MLPLEILLCNLLYVASRVLDLCLNMQCRYCFLLIEQLRQAGWVKPRRAEVFSHWTACCNISSAAKAPSTFTRRKIPAPAGTGWDWSWGSATLFLALFVSHLPFWTESQFTAVWSAETNRLRLCCHSEGKSSALSPNLRIFNRGFWKKRERIWEKEMTEV